MYTCNLRVRLSFVAGVMMATLLWITPSKSLAQREDVVKAGRPTFEQSCAVCHGRGGKGDGGAVNLLTVKPADLTQISKKNGGNFPFWRVYSIIDGREKVLGHGGDEMPIWGSVFRMQAGGGADAEAQVRGRILELVYYLESIQEK
jgi:mono/diheme cytochrome c family protein